MSVAKIILKGTERLLDLQNRDRCEGSLIEFSEYIWPVVEPAIPFVRGWVLDAIADHLGAVAHGHIRRLLINVPPGFTKSLMTDVFFPAWLWGPLNRPHMRFLCASYSEHLTVRDNMRCRSIITSDRYQGLWKNRFRVSSDQFTKIKFANDKTGWKLATSVGGIGTGERADIVIVDDANNPMEMESEAVRETTKMWFTEILPDRLNNQSLSSIIVIQQRTHQEDVSGIALSREMGYTHLNIPMRYDRSRHCVTVLGLDEAGGNIVWEDPRTEEGELAWIDRFPPKIVDELQRDKGPYAWCNPAEAPVLMSDLSLMPIGDVRVGDKVIGFAGGNTERRARYKPAHVLSISKSVRPVVKITLDSGEVIRCTEDHKWWTGRNDKSHPPYASAKLKSWLARVCPPRLPTLDAEAQRLAGWLAGFFDGEGTVSINKRRDGEGTPLVGFAQGDGRNGPICDKLEYVLKRFGFHWGVWKKKTADSASHSVRMYWLKMAKNGRASRLPLYQRFLHIVQPIKWKDRLLEATVTGRMYCQWERVISIQPDGVETVYGLETTTGNYVVWGFASSNSGQYQQLPTPRGGSIIKDDYWQVWSEKLFPNLEYVIASLDSAYTEKETNDPSALTIWGVFRDDTEADPAEANDVLWQPRDGQTLRPVTGRPKIILMWAWEDWLTLHDLVERVISCCIKGPHKSKWGDPSFAVDRLLIESKASGISVYQEICRLIRGSGNLGVELIDPKKYGDKVARLHGVQHLFADKMVYAPLDPDGSEKKYVSTVIDQCAMFPNGARDDLVDSTSMALRWLREMGFALRREENALAAEDEMRYISPSSALPLYQV